MSRKVDTLGGKDVTMYVKGGAGVSAGAVQLEGSPTGSLAAEPSQSDWVAIGSPVTVVANTTGSSGTSQAHRYVRARVSTTVVGGQCTVYLDIGGNTEGRWWDETPDETGSYYGINPNGQRTGTGFVSSEGLILAWDMETLAGSLMADLSGGGNTGTISGPTDVAGKFGRARNHNLGTIATADAISKPQSGTISFWIRPDPAIAPPAAGQFPALAGFHNVDDPAIYVQASTGNPYIQAVFPVSGAQSAISTVALVASVWQHIAATWLLSSGATTLSLYINGMLRAKTEVPDALGADTQLIRTGDAARNDGDIDELLVFTKALTEREIKALANRAGR